MGGGGGGLERKAFVLHTQNQISTKMAAVIFTPNFSSVDIFSSGNSEVGIHLTKNYKFDSEFVLKLYLN